MPLPTSAELRREIESGPLHSECAGHWANTFDDEPDDSDRWHRIKHRQGFLHPDAAYTIHALLTDPTRRSSRGPSCSIERFNALLVPITIALLRAPTDVQSRWDRIARSARSADDSQPLAWSLVLGLLDQAVRDELLTGPERDALTRPRPCSRAEELGWMGLTADHVAAAKVGA